MNTAGNGIATVALIALMPVGSIFLWIVIPVGNDGSARSFSLVRDRRVWPLSRRSRRIMVPLLRRIVVAWRVNPGVGSSGGAPILGAA